MKRLLRFFRTIFRKRKELGIEKLKRVDIKCGYVNAGETVLWIDAIYTNSISKRLEVIVLEGDRFTFFVNREEAYGNVQA